MANRPEIASPAGAGAKPRRWVTIALVVSVCLNLLVLGAGVGMVMRMGGMSHAELPSGFDRITLYQVFHALPDAERDAAYALLRDRRGELDALRAAQKTARDEIAGALEADRLDAAALAAALARTREAEARSRAMVDAVFVRFMGGLEADTRRQIARRLRHRPEFGHMMGRRDHRGWRKD